MKELITSMIAESFDNVFVDEVEGREDFIRQLAVKLNSLVSCFTKEEEIWVDIASNPLAPEELLNWLAGKGNAYICLHLVDNPSITEETLALLAVNNNIDVRLKVTNHNLTSNKTLELLSLDINTAIRNIARRRLPS